ncbi:MAG: hypothetical protein QF655_02895 [Candidatus Woesearchaeota archaeon]|nr:hypothetical protein [Candidatus Woesearchaeota archaeon]MDP7322822.1 hypothetical protein [Candidatus Woesearchaeota archaeon]MDP7476549.1 hypothetical protein [Candidatus Woesearchaeota archaeon]HJO01501.1 hypothetical protein [Candidatus Woesearchaeota archaeon]
MRHQILLVMFLVFGLIGTIRTYDYGDGMSFVHVNVNNDGAEDLDDLSVRVLIYDLGVIFQTNSFDLNDGDVDGKFLFLNTADVQPGTYLARITASNDDVRDVRHRYITIA